MKQKYIRQAAVFVIATVFYGIAAASMPEFVRVTLPECVSIDVPRDWTVASNGVRELMDAWIQAQVITPPLVDTHLGFLAESYDLAEHRLGSINVRYYANAPITQAQVARALPTELDTLDRATRVAAESDMKAMKSQILSWESARVQVINGISAVVMTYTRSGSIMEEGVFHVQLTRVYDGPQSFTLTTSYRESSAETMKPVMDHIVGSLTHECAVNSRQNVIVRDDLVSGLPRSGEFSDNPHEQLSANVALDRSAKSEFVQKLANLVSLWPIIIVAIGTLLVVSHYRRMRDHYAGRDALKFEWRNGATEGHSFRLWTKRLGVSIFFAVFVAFTVATIFSYLSLGRDQRRYQEFLQHQSKPKSELEILIDSLPEDPAANTPAARAAREERDRQLGLPPRPFHEYFVNIFLHSDMLKVFVIVAVGLFMILTAIALLAREPNKGWQRLSITLATIVSFISAYFCYLELAHRFGPKIEGRTLRLFFSILAVGVIFSSAILITLGLVRTYLWVRDGFALSRPGDDDPNTTSENAVAGPYRVSSSQDPRRTIEKRVVSDKNSSSSENSEAPHYE